MLLGHLDNGVDPLDCSEVADRNVPGDKNGK